MQGLQLTTMFFVVAILLDGTFTLFLALHDFPTGSHHRPNQHQPTSTNSCTPLLLLSSGHGSGSVNIKLKALLDTALIVREELGNVPVTVCEEQSTKPKLMPRWRIHHAQKNAKERDIMIQLYKSCHDTCLCSLHQDYRHHPRRCQCKPSWLPMSSSPIPPPPLCATTTCALLCCARCCISEPLV